MYLSELAISITFWKCWDSVHLFCVLIGVHGPCRVNNLFQWGLVWIVTIIVWREVANEQNYLTEIESVFENRSQWRNTGIFLTGTHTKSCTRGNIAIPFFTYFYFVFKCIIYSTNVTNGPILFFTFTIEKGGLVND